jgi:hypothetical protein
MDCKRESVICAVPRFLEQIDAEKNSQKCLLGQPKTRFVLVLLDQVRNDKPNTVQVPREIRLSLNVK